MQTFIYENLQYFVMALLLMILIQFIFIVYLKRRLKILFKIADWLLIFENLMSQVFKKEIESYIDIKSSEMAEQKQKKRETATNIYKRYENNVASSPVTSKW